MKFNEILIGIIVTSTLISSVFFLWSLSDDPQEEFYFSSNNSNLITSNLSSQPTGIIFYADYINFTDKNLTITFDDDIYLWYMNEFDYMEWNLGNETYRFQRINKTGEYQKI